MADSIENIAIAHTQIKFIRKMSVVAIVMSIGFSAAATIQDGQWYMLIAIPFTVAFRKFVKMIWGDIYDVSITEEEIYLLDLRKSVLLDTVTSIKRKPGIGAVMVELKTSGTVESIQFVCTPGDYRLLVEWIGAAGNNEKAAFVDEG